jgi:hypothetical protein
LEGKEKKKGGGKAADLLASRTGQGFDYRAEVVFQRQ